jgi:hypothetical protein
MNALALCLISSSVSDEIGDGPTGFLHRLSSSSENATCGWVPAEMRARTEATDVMCPGAWLPPSGGNGSACLKSASTDGEATASCDTPEACEERCAICAVELAKDGQRGCNAFDFQPPDGPNREACWFKHVNAWNFEQVSGNLRIARNESNKSEYQLSISCNDCSTDPLLDGCGTTYARSDEDGASGNTTDTILSYVFLGIGCCVFGFILCLFLKNTFDITFNYT